MFLVENSSKFICSRLFYSYKQYSFFCNPRFMQVYSLLINDLDFGLNDDFELVSVSGLSGFSSWTKKELSIPKSIPGVLRYIDESLRIGISYRLAEMTAYIDEEKGWVLIGDFSPVELVVQVLDGVLIALNQGKIHAVWLKPIFQG